MYSTKYDLIGNPTEIYKNKSGTTIMKQTTGYDTRGIYITTVSTTGENSGTSTTTYTYDNQGRSKTITTGDIIKTFTYGTNNKLSFLETNIKNEKLTTEYHYNSQGLLYETVFPDNTKQTYTYNTAGKLTQNGNALTYTNTNAMLSTIISSISYNTTCSAYITSYNKGGITNSYMYDSANRVSSKQFKKNATNYMEQSYTYDMTGNITKVTEVETGELIATPIDRTYTYDNYNRLTKAEYTGNIIAEIPPLINYQSYDYNETEWKGNKNMLSDNSKEQIDIDTRAPSLILRSKYDLNADLNPNIIRIYKPANSKITKDLIKLFFLNGEIFEKKALTNNQIVENDGYIELKNFTLNKSDLLKLTFLLDGSDKNNIPAEKSGRKTALGDMIKLYAKGDTIQYTYTYDMMDNRQTETKKLLSVTKELRNTTTTSTYDGNRLLTSDGTYDYTYNKNGSLSTKTGINQDVKWYYTWDNRGNLVDIKKTTKTDPTTILYQETNLYDETNTRVYSDTTNATIYYLYNGNDLIYQKEITKTSPTTTIRKYLYGLDGLEATVEKKGTENETIAYNQNEINNTTRFITNADGVVRNGSDRVTAPFGETLAYNTDGDGSSHYQWSTHDGIEEETGLTYMISRWMDNSNGRFISADSAKDGLNYYVYCNNNPISRIDPDGRIATIIIGAILGAVNGALIGWDKGLQETEAAGKRGEKYSHLSMFVNIMVGAVVGSIAGGGMGALSGFGGLPSMLATMVSLTASAISLGAAIGVQLTDDPQIKSMLGAVSKAGAAISGACDPAAKEGSDTSSQVANFEAGLKNGVITITGGGPLGYSGAEKGRSRYNSPDRGGGGGGGEDSHKQGSSKDEPLTSWGTNGGAEGDMSISGYSEATVSDFVNSGGNYRNYYNDYQNGTLRGLSSYRNSGEQNAIDFTTNTSNSEVVNGTIQDSLASLMGIDRIGLSSSGGGGMGNL